MAESEDEAQLWLEITFKCQTHFLAFNDNAVEASDHLPSTLILFYMNVLFIITEMCQQMSTLSLTINTFSIQNVEPWTTASLRRHFSNRPTFKIILVTLVLINNVLALRLFMVCLGEMFLTTRQSLLIRAQTSVRWKNETLCPSSEAVRNSWQNDKMGSSFKTVCWAKWKRMDFAPHAAEYLKKEHPTTFEVKGYCIGILG